MSDLLEKMRRARESKVEAEGRTFIVRRPTDAEMVQFNRDGATLLDIAKRCTVGWVGVKEIDLVPGGSPVPVEFDAAVFSEWVEDQPALWGVLADAVLSGYKAHTAKRGEIAKNSSPGSNQDSSQASSQARPRKTPR